jgi:hypothetical protein
VRHTRAGAPAARLDPLGLAGSRLAQRISKRTKVGRRVLEHSQHGGVLVSADPDTTAVRIDREADPLCEIGFPRLV